MCTRPNADITPKRVGAFGYWLPRRLLLILLLLLLTETLQLLQQLFGRLDLLLLLLLARLLLLLLARRRRRGLLRRHVLHRLAFAAAIDRRLLGFFLIFVALRRLVGLAIRRADTCSRSGAMRTQNDRSHLGWILQAANQDEVVVRAIKQ